MYRKQNRAKTGKRFGWSKNGRVTSVIGAWGGVTVGSNQLQAGTRGSATTLGMKPYTMVSFIYQIKKHYLLLS